MPIEPAPRGGQPDPAEVTNNHFEKGGKYSDFQQYSLEKPEMALRNGTGSGLNTDAWMTLLAALVAGAVVVLMVGMDGFM